MPYHWRQSEPIPRARSERGEGGLRAGKDIKVIGAEVYFLPIETRVPLKFGAETLTSVTCARAKVVIEDSFGNRAVGWGETPLSVQWVWPSKESFKVRSEVLRRFCERLANRWARFELTGHPLEIGHVFQTDVLSSESELLRMEFPGVEQAPLLASLVCCSPYDIAVYDAYGKLHGVSSFDTLTNEYMEYDLARYLEPEPGSGVNFHGTYPCHYMASNPPKSLLAWHLVGGLDPIDADDLEGDEPADGHPVLLKDWIQRDGLCCLKIKLCGTDSSWDYDRLIRVGRVAAEYDVRQLTVDFNCTVTDPTYVTDILDRLEAEDPETYDRILYIEQPFPYDLEANLIPVHSISRRKLLLMDESAHNWQLVRLGRFLGWNGVALKTCKTLTGAILSLCWAKAHGMAVMVQDLTNPMIAQAPHVLLAAHSQTIMGVETNAMQFYPNASDAEAVVHPGLYQRRDGRISLSTLSGPGFGYRIDEVQRSLPKPAATFGVTA